MQALQTRELRIATPGMTSIDGDGVKLQRLIGQPQLDMLDPFLLLDNFKSDEALDYIGGFPSHPHRGFETVTYMHAGQMRHKDSAGNEGVIGPHGVQWMTAGRGIVHSEMPEQSEGLLSGFQLWVNLPRTEKMRAPAYQEFDSNQIPEEIDAAGNHIRVIAGQTMAGTQGPIINDYIDPVYFDVTLAAQGSFEQQIAHDATALIFVVNGELSVGDNHRQLRQGHVGVLSRGDNIKLTTFGDNTQFLLIAGMPLNEPVKRAGPFVMNTQEELLQAFDDFKHNRF